MSTSEIQDAPKAEPKDDDPVAAKAFVAEDEGEKSWKIHDEQVLPKNNLPLVFFSLLLATFLVGSALCGAAQNMPWLIVARAIQGIGGGGIFQMVNITIGDIVPLEK
ncbi:hypothetical protein PHLCEN_2v1691 [Hermanssonia centrifuga]|uniref:Major facilitator superfamily (MFS) profile domain-containing protein n=1 Tax=Hermanssonia centrifuga TaxID=98765 RepID=A0A2R6RZ91_9APHY|nr:hypothetical protein PHLCEN_2v1691 [Hermanssonia centrifuga]